MYTIIILGLLMVLLYFLYRSGKVVQFINYRPTSKQKVFRNVLERAKSAFDTAEVPFFICTGTCLGYERERDFIAHDRDIDLGVFAEDYQPELLKELENAGFRLYHKTGDTFTFHIPDTPHTKSVLDVCIHRQSEDQVCWDSKNNGTRCVRPFQVTERDFLGMKIQVPEPTREYLVQCYGKSYRIPRV